MHELLVAREDSWGALFYVALALGMSVEGELLLFAAAFAAWNGLLDPVLVAIASASGIFLGTVGWYALGVWLTERTRFRPVRLLMRATRRFTDQLGRRPARTLFLSSFVYGLYRPTQIRAGMMGMDIRRYLKLAVPTSVAWIMVVVGLAWIASVTVAPVLKYFRYFEIALLIGVLGFIAFQALLGLTVRKLAPETDLQHGPKEGPGSDILGE